MIRVYIAGAITNNIDYKKEFKKAEKKLRDVGFEVVNPIYNINKVNSIEDYKELIDLGLKDLMSCDCIYMLKGHKKSKGATLERNYAKLVGIKIMHEM